MKKITAKTKGDVGEKYTEKYLKKHGCKILEKNYQRPYGEIDIIADDGTNILFVEVKTRHFNPMTKGYEAVDWRKIKRIVKTASYYLTEKKLDRYCRFDVAEVFINRDTLKPIEIKYTENAFDGGGYYF